jgi:serine/threonine protein kinase
MATACPACHAPNDPASESCFTCGQALHGNTLRLGSVVAGRYELQSQLGRGGMGVVYKAHDRLLDESVAIKVLRPDVARDPEISRRFQSEIKLARKVSHRNVCRIHEYGEDASGLRYISMELLEGVDLRQVLRQQGGLPAEEAFRTALQIADGLQAIHEMGVIHRDLKTPNIMRDARGTVRLMDFGIAKEWGAATSATATGLVMGTPEYMSPEQARGDKIDFRSDVYALGIIVYELFTGRVPFRAETPLATILKQLQDPPPLDGPEAAALPEAVKPVLRRALAKQAAERYETVHDLAEALRAAQRAQPPSEPQPVTAIPMRAGDTISATAATWPRPAPDPAPPSLPMPATQGPLPHTQGPLPPTQAGPWPPAQAQPLPAAPSPPPPPPRAVVPPVAAAPSRPAMAARRAAPKSRAPLVIAIAGGAVLVIAVTVVLAVRYVQTMGAAASPPSGPVAGPASAEPAPPNTIAEQAPVSVVAEPIETAPVTTLTPAPAVRDPVAETTVRPTAPPPPSPRVVVAQQVVPVPARPSLAPPTPAPAPTPAPIPEAVAELMPGLSDRDANARWRAAEQLGILGAQARPAVPGMVALLQDRNEVVRWRAAEALGKIGPEARGAVSALVAALRDKPGLLTTEAAKALGRIAPGSAEAVPALAEAVRSTEVFTRREAAKALGRAGAEGAAAVPALVDGLRDKDKIVRMEAARALGRMGPAARSAAAALTAAARDSDNLVALTASQALEQVQR